MFTDFLQDVTVNKSSVESERSALTFRPSPRLALQLGRLAAASLCQVLHRSPPQTKQWNEAADLLFQEFTHLEWVQQRMDHQWTQSEEWVTQRQSPGCRAFLRQRLLTHERAVVLHLAECCHRVMQLTQALGQEEEQIHSVLLQSAEWAVAGLLVLGSVDRTSGV